MKYNQLTNTDLSASVICLGTLEMGSIIEDNASSHMLEAYLDHGGNFLDTAEVYANWLPIEPSSSERFLGKWMKERAIRSHIILATKGGHPKIEAKDISRLFPEDIKVDIEGSLSRLNTDYIDLYYLHRDDLSLPVENIIETMESHVRRGDIRYYACSNWTLPRIEQAQQYAKKKGYVGFVAVQNLWNLAQINPESMTDKTLVVSDQSMTNWHEETKIAAIPFSSQANGFFSGKYKRGELTDSIIESNVYKRYFNDINFKRLEKVQSMAKKMDSTPNQIALAYLLGHPFPTFPVVGCKKKEHLLDSLGAAEISLDHTAILSLTS